ncbi:hypothetical protein BIW11_05653 [Tropilaelaps mercedesae]|uniref:Uncharacterized protein n=1 Tax=Tropilaelaps mercedesae TaxID=418985 RepID=A0A1V9Y1E6_9ACAR|nr:hypothetical protein BIW11_05653 [Tropilaelaps mercedesae]
MLEGRRIFAEFRKQEAIFKSEISSLCNSAALKDGQIAELKKCVANEQTRRTAAEEALKKSTTSMNIAENRLKDALEELKTEQNLVHDLHKKNALLQQERVALAARLNTNSEQNHHLSQELARLREEYENLMNVHSNNVKKNLELELGNYVPKTEFDRAMYLLETQQSETERLRNALQSAEARQRDWRQQHGKLLQDWHHDKMLLHDCRKEIKTFKLLIDQMDLATPKNAQRKLSASPDGIGRIEQQRVLNVTDSQGGRLSKAKSTSCIFM